MKNKRSNKQLYQDAFRQIKLSDERYRQIRNMEENTMIHFDKKTKKRLGFRAAISLAALTIVFLSANGIAYAATGSTLIEQVAEHVSVYVDGKPYDSAKVSKFKDKNGDTHYQVTVDDDTKSVTMTESGEEDLKTSIKQLNDTTYLIIEGITEKPVKIDITQDYADGSAEGTVQIEKADYQYKVNGTLEKYAVDLEKR